MAEPQDDEMKNNQDDPSFEFDPLLTNEPQPIDPDKLDEEDEEDFDDETPDSDICDACGLSPDRPRIRIKVRRGRRVQVVSLCEECAGLWGFAKEDSGIPFRVGDLFFPSRDDEYPELQCPSCTRSLIDIRMSGQVGCPNCYHTFRQDILLLIHGYEKEIIHRGDVPKALATLRTLLKLDQGDVSS